MSKRKYSQFAQEQEQEQKQDTYNENEDDVILNADWHKQTINQNNLSNTDFWSNANSVSTLRQKCGIFIIIISWTTYNEIKSKQKIVIKVKDYLPKCHEYDPSISYDLQWYLEKELLYNKEKGIPFMIAEKLFNAYQKTVYIVKHVLGKIPNLKKITKPIFLTCIYFNPEKNYPKTNKNKLTYFFDPQFFKWNEILDLICTNNYCFRPRITTPTIPNNKTCEIHFFMHENKQDTEMFETLIKKYPIPLLRTALSNYQVKETLYFKTQQTRVPTKTYDHNISSDGFQKINFGVKDDCIFIKKIKKQ